MATNLATVGSPAILEPGVWGFDLARLAGLEPATGCLEGSCSVQLSYRRRGPIVQAPGHVTDTCGPSDTGISLPGTAPQPDTTAARQRAG